MLLASFPKQAISLPTSAALDVLYFKHAPDSGSNVLSTKLASCVGGSETGVGEEESAAAADLEGRRRFLAFVGWTTLYFEVIRVCEGVLTVVCGNWRGLMKVEREMSWEDLRL